MFISGNSPTSTRLFITFVKKLRKFWEILEPIFERNIYQNVSLRQDQFNDARFNLYALTNWTGRVRLVKDFEQNVIKLQNVNTFKNVPSLAEHISSNRKNKINKSDQWKRQSRIFKASSIARAMWLKSRGIEHNPVDSLKARKTIMKAWHSILDRSATKKIKAKTGFFANFKLLKTFKTKNYRK